MGGLSKNACFEALFDGYTAEGHAVCRHEGMAVFVPGGIRGERAEVRVLKVLRSYAFGRIERLLDPSPRRVTPDCPHFPACGGCDFRHMDYEEECALKAVRVRDALVRLGGFRLDTPDLVPAPEGARTRNKAQFPLSRAADGRAVFGFYRARSHALVPLRQCPLVAPEALALAEAVCRWADARGVSIYDEAKQGGLLRTVYVRSGDGHLLTVVSTGPVPDAGGLAAAARAACPDLRGVVLNHNDRAGNRVLGPRCETLWGEGELEDTLLGSRYRLSPLSFYQVNRPQAERLYAHARALAAPGGHGGAALDLYCGVGTITLTLAPVFDEVVGVELVPDAVRDARANAARNGVGNARFLCGDAGALAHRLAAEGFAPETVICDPPRKGLDESCRAALAVLRPQRLVYISCDCASLARDAKALCADGWTLSHVRAFDLFPRTANVEAVALLTRAEG